MQPHQNFSAQYYSSSRTIKNIKYISEAKSKGSWLSQFSIDGRGGSPDPTPPPPWIYPWPLGGENMNVKAQPLLIGPRKEDVHAIGQGNMLTDGTGTFRDHGGMPQMHVSGWVQAAATVHFLNCW